MHPAVRPRGSISLPNLDGFLASYGEKSMGTREVSAVAAGLLALVATALVAAPDRVAAAEPVGGTIRGTVYDADDPADPTAADVQTKLYRWNVATSSFAPAD